MATQLRSVLALILGLVLAAAIALLSRAETAGEEPSAKPLTIVATTGMIADTVREIAGDRAEVVGLMGPGVDPHLYKPTRSDFQRILGADVIFYNGLLLEGKMTDALVRSESSGRSVVAVTAQLEASDLLSPEGFEGQSDPHVWMNPELWTAAVEVIRDTLIERDPDHSAVYRERAEAYRAQLASLESYAERVLATVPAEQRVLITAHDAFNYFGHRFGFEVVGIQGISTQSEAGLRDIERLVDLIVDRKIGAVFVESTVSDRHVRALIGGAQARGHTVVIGGQLFSDAMGNAGTYEGTYIGMIDHNVTTIARALGGTAPEAGFTGQLTR